MKPLRTLISPVIIAAVAIAGVSAVPAKAGNDDIAKLLFGIAAAAIVVKSIENKSKAKSSSVEVTSSNAGRVVTLPKPKKKKSKKRVSYAVPQTCVKTYSSNRGARELYSGRCLSRLPYTLAKLPDACAYTIEGRRGTVGKAYGPRCLARYGFHQVEEKASNKRVDRHIVYTN